MTEPTAPNMTELFQRDPLELTKTDITAIITKFREDRATFKAGALTGASAKKKTPAKPKATDGINIDISL